MYLQQVNDKSRFAGGLKFTFYVGKDCAIFTNNSLVNDITRR